MLTRQPALSKKNYNTPVNVGVTWSYPYHTDIFYL